MYEVSPLPFGYAELEPYIDEETMRVHHDKHHQAYADKLNVALATNPILLDKDLRELIWHADELPEEIRGAVVNNGGGYLNHNFFWTAIAKPRNKTNNPDGLSIAEKLAKTFDGFDGFVDAFKMKAMSLFGSGWVWLVLDKEGKLKIVSTSNQEILPRDLRALACIDLWEHAYYLKYQNRRSEYVDNFMNVINWENADALLKLNM